jgi:hypothetical protein
MQADPFFIKTMHERVPACVVHLHEASLASREGGQD